MANLSKFGLFFIALICLLPTGIAVAQSTVTSGNWSDPTVWSGGVPNQGTATTVNINNPLTIDTNFGPSTGTWNFNSNATDAPGGTAYTFTPTGGTINIAAGVTVTFEGAATFDGAKIDVFGTLILGATTINNNGGNNIIVEPGGTLIINGDFIDKDNSGTDNINGALIVNGNLDCQTGSITVGGTGTIDATGFIKSNGGSLILGSQNDCNQGPCSGSSLACAFDNYISPGSQTMCASAGLSVMFTANPLPHPTPYNAPTGTVTYQWKSSTDNITFSNVGTNSSTYTTPPLASTTYIKLSVTSSTVSCTSTSATTKITVLGVGGWNGSTSNDWGTPSNWCGTPATLPDLNTDVIIVNAPGIPNMPTVNALTSAVCKSLTINNTTPASSVTIAASTTASLSIYGNFTNNGIFQDNSTAATAGVKFVGGGSQTIGGTTANVFNNLTIANTSGSTSAISIANNNVTVVSNLTLTSGMINLNGLNVTLGTSASTTTVSHTSGNFYGGNISRWFLTGPIPIGNGLLPIGTSTSYRPIYFGNAGLTAAGTIKVSHTGITGATDYGASSFVDNGGVVTRRTNSFWTVTTGNGIGTGTHSLRTEANNIGTITDFNFLRLTLVNGIAPGTDGTHAGIPDATNPQVNRTGLTTANLTNNFYWGSTSVSINPLPIKLSKFTGIPALDGVQLYWTTQSEENSDHFVLERSEEGDAFYSITTIKAHGTTASVSNYSYLDAGVVGRNYYRLKSVDFDGRYEYSQVIVVDAGGVVLFPNPVTDHKLSVKLSSAEPGTLVMIDCAGKVIMNQNFSDYYFQVVLPESIQSGIYFMRLQQGASQKTIRIAVINNN